MLGRYFLAPGFSIVCPSMLTREHHQNLVDLAENSSVSDQDVPGSTSLFNAFAGDVNLENRLQKAARNIPQQQQMRAYSTTSRPSNALRDSRHSQRAPLMTSTRSYATQTTNPNPPYGRLFSIRPRVTSKFILIALQVPRTAPTKRHQKSPLSVCVHIPVRLKAVSNHAQAPEVTPDKVRDVPLQSSRQFQLQDVLRERGSWCSLCCLDLPCDSSFNLEKGMLIAMFY